jgi:hypothetical protein
MEHDGTVLAGAAGGSVQDSTDRRGRVGHDERRLTTIQEEANMLKVSGRTALFPVSLLVFGLIALISPPGTVGGTLLVLLVGLAIPAIVLIVWKETPPTVAEVLHAAEVDTRRRSEPGPEQPR